MLRFTAYIFNSFYNFFLVQFLDNLSSHRASKTLQKIQNSKMVQISSRPARDFSPAICNSVNINIDVARVTRVYVRHNNHTLHKSIHTRSVCIGDLSWSIWLYSLKATTRLRLKVQDETAFV